MGRMSIITAYYNISVDILKEYLDIVPKLKLTNAKTYMGKIYYTNGEAHTIALSKRNLDCGYFWEDEDVSNLIDTICHELAHIVCRGHTKEHAKLTKLYNDAVECGLKVQGLKLCIN